MPKGTSWLTRRVLVGAGIVGGVSIFPLLLLINWANSSIPESFPIFVEELDHQAWVAGAPVLFPQEYAEFHQQISQLRTHLLGKQNEWWKTWDSEKFDQAYNDLVRKGTRLIEASEGTKEATRKELEEFLQGEQSQIARLRSLSRNYQFPGTHAYLSNSEGLLEEARQWLLLKQFEKARHAGQLAIHHLEKAEAVVLKNLKRYISNRQLAIWQQWVHETVQRTTRSEQMVVIVAKASRKLMVYQKGKVRGVFPVELGFNGLQDKLYEGDGATPEGQFQVIRKKGQGETQYYKALLLNYPTKDHTRRFLQAKAKRLIPPTQSIGGLIEIHGKPPNGQDITSGCVALENAAMDQVFELAKEGTPVTIVGAVQKENAITEVLRKIETHIAGRTKSSEGSPDPHV